MQEENPFAEFDEATGTGLVVDPYAKFLELMAESPVFEGKLVREFGLPEMTIPGTEHSQHFAALSFEAVSQVLLDGETFSSKGYANSMGLVMGHSILEMDEPEHRSYRSLLNPAFTLKAMERWKDEVVQPIVDARLDEIAGRGKAELVSELTFPFPIQAIAAMMGLPEEDLPRFHRLAVELISISVNIERGFAASQSLRDYFSGIVAQRRVAPGRDLISILVEADLDGKRLADEEIFAFLRLLLPAGAETTYRSTSNLLAGLLNEPEQLEALRDDRSLLRQAIEEGLRWEPPLTQIVRTATRDTEVCGVTIPEGAQVTVCLGAANHDPSRWEHPEKLDIFRKPRNHMAFATGPHTCLGIHLARMESEVAINAVLDRLPNLRRDPDAGDIVITGLMFRAPARLPVLFDEE
jgi:cytochrome P450